VEPPYKSSLESALSRNISASRMYLRSTLTLAWPVCFWIDLSKAPAIAAEVAKPARSEWPEKSGTRFPICLQYLLTISATTRSQRRVGRGNPFAKRPNRAGQRILAVRNPDLPAFTLLVGLSLPGRTS